MFGYDKIPGNYFDMKVNEREAAVVRQIFQWYREEGYGAAKIAIMLNERRIRTKRNCAWSSNAVMRILSNELYTGKIINGKQEVADFLTGKRKDRDAAEWLVVEKPELCIISPAEFAEAQSHPRARTGFQGR